jgi:hypothetical protein
MAVMPPAICSAVWLADLNRGEWFPEGVEPIPPDPEDRDTGFGRT